MTDDMIVADHERLADKGKIRYDWRHYVPLLERKPGALRNGAPFADLPEPLQRMRRALLRESGGDRLMAKILALVPGAGLDAVLVAVDLALEGAPPSGRVSEQHVINVLGRLNAPPRPANVTTRLQASTRRDSCTAAGSRSRGLRRLEQSGRGRDRLTNDGTRCLARLRNRRRRWVAPGRHRYAQRGHRVVGERL